MVQASYLLCTCNKGAPMTVQPRKPTNLSLDADFLAQGRGLNINLSRGCKTARARRRPIFDVRPSRFLPPLECCLGLRPTQAATSRSFEKVSIGGAKVVIAAAMIGPIPGTVLRCPAQPLLGRGQVEFIVVAGDIHHPHPDEGIPAEDAVLGPGNQFSCGGREVPCHPVLAVHLAPDQTLQLTQGDQLGLAGRPRHSGRRTRQGEHRPRSCRHRQAAAVPAPCYAALVCDSETVHSA